MLPIPMIAVAMAPPSFYLTPQLTKPYPANIPTAMPAGHVTVQRLLHTWATISHGRERALPTRTYLVTARW
jgi:hypothetical protein